MACQSIVNRISRSRFKIPPREKFISRECIDNDLIKLKRELSRGDKELPTAVLFSLEYGTDTEVMEQLQLRVS